MFGMQALPSTSRERRINRLGKRCLVEDTCDLLRPTHLDISYTWPDTCHVGKLINSVCGEQFAGKSPLLVKRILDTTPSFLGAVAEADKPLRRVT